jgi:hypothetical protein
MRTDIVKTRLREEIVEEDRVPVVLVFLSILWARTLALFCTKGVPRI